MALYGNGTALIRKNLEDLHQGKRVSLVVIGILTQKQHEDINALKEKLNLPLLQNPEIVFIGSHLYKSRVTQDGYTLDDVMLQIESAMAVTSVVRDGSPMTNMRSTIRRADGYGNLVYDQAVFELTTRKPRAELFSVIPKGDKNKPKKVVSSATTAIASALALAIQKAATSN
jgi:hypothetical protein